MSNWSDPPDSKKFIGVGGIHKPKDNDAFSQAQNSQDQGTEGRGRTRTGERATNEKNLSEVGPSRSGGRRPK